MATPSNPLSVVCFGDSLTWGFDPVDRTRYGHDVRWTRLLQRELGDDYYVIEEGLNGRTTVFEDPVRGDRNGLAHLETVRRSHMPIDILVMMLGTNDLQTRFGMSAGAIALAMARLLDYARRPTDDPEGRAPKILLMAPPPLVDLTGSRVEAVFSGEDSIAISKQLGDAYRQIAEDYGAAFLDTGTIVSASPLDGVHLGPEMQAPLAKAIAEEVRKLA